MWKQKTELTEVDAPELEEREARLDPATELPAPTAEEELEDQQEGADTGHGTQTQIEQLTAERDRLLDRLARLQAEFENARKRAERERAEARDFVTASAVEQFLPSLGAGVLLTIVLARFVPGALWMLPGLWQVCSGIGIFSSCRFLPRPMLAAGAWYLLCGLLCISLGGERALSPWAMGIPYGAGQLMVAGILVFAAQEGSDES